jgi:hypothetical protein
MKKQVKNQNSISDAQGVSRRHFVKVAGITALGVSSLGLPELSAQGVSVIVDPSDLIAGAQPSKWALKELEEAITSQRIGFSKCEKISQSKAGDLNIVVAGLGSALTGQILKTTKTNIPAVPESLGLVPAKYEGKQVNLWNRLIFKNQ